MSNDQVLEQSSSTKSDNFGSGLERIQRSDTCLVVDECLIKSGHILTLNFF